MTATWTRPDQTYRPEGHWYGKPATQMALDLRRGYDAADAASAAIDRVNPVGQAFNCAIQAGFADLNPYDGIAYDQLDLRSEEHTSELQSLMRISYAVFCLKKKKNNIK